MTHNEFLSFVLSYVEANPEVGAKVADFAQAGINAALAKAYERAADMEVALLAATVKRDSAGVRALIKDKLLKWQGKTSLRWEWLTEKL